MLVAIVFHAYFDVDIEELLNDRKLYVCDKINVFVGNVLKKMGLEKWVLKRQDNRLKAELDRHITYQDAYKILKR